MLDILRAANGMLDVWGTLWVMLLVHTGLAFCLLSAYLYLALHLLDERIVLWYRHRRETRCHEDFMLSLQASLLAKKRV
jgi:hypothetical protein